MESSSKQFVFGILLLAQLMGSRDAADIISPPQNMYGMEGDSLNITCQVTGDVMTDPFEWKEWISSSSGRRIFSMPEQNPIDSSMYAIFGTYDLNIKSLNWMSNGGLYGCKLWTMDEDQVAHVFVFQQHLLTANKMEVGQIQQLSCESRFGAEANLGDGQGIARPTMTMDVAGNTLFDINTTFTDKTDANPYVLRGTANYTARTSDDAMDFACTVSISEPNAQIRETTKMNIQYPVETPLFYPNNALYYVGEVINCSARGNPTADYVWRSVESPLGEEIIGFQLDVTSAMIGSNSWECEATNRMDSATSPTSVIATISFDVQADPADPGDVKSSGVEGWKIAVGICVPLAIIAIIVGVILALHFKKKKQRAAAYASKVPPPEAESHGTTNQGAAFPGDGELVNGKPKDTNRTPISKLPDPMSQNAPVNRSKDSPGYADLGIKQITGSSDLGYGGLPWYGGHRPRYPGVNVSVNSSMDSFDDDVEPTVVAQPNPTFARQPPPGILRQPGSQPQAYRNSSPDRYANANPSFERESPQSNRPQNLDLKPNHPDTFV